MESGTKNVNTDGTVDFVNTLPMKNVTRLKPSADDQIGCDT